MRAFDILIRPKRQELAIELFKAFAVVDGNHIVPPVAGDQVVSLRRNPRGVDGP
jgi:hypothetical protein